MFIRRNLLAISLPHDGLLYSHHNIMIHIEPYLYWYMLFHQLARHSLTHWILASSLEISFHVQCCSTEAWSELSALQTISLTWWVLSTSMSSNSIYIRSHSRRRHSCTHATNQQSRGLPHQFRLNLETISAPHAIAYGSSTPPYQGFPFTIILSAPIIPAVLKSINFFLPLMAFQFSAANP